MKKKMFTIIVVAALTLGLVACGSGSSGDSGDSDSDSTLQYDEDGNRIMETDTSYTVFPDALPCGLDYNGEEVVLESVDYYEQTGITSGDYQFYSVVKVDVSALDEEHLEKLQQGVNLSVNVYITSDENGYDFDGMTEMGHVYLEDTGELLYGFYNILGHADQYSFSGASATCALNLRVDDGDITQRAMQYRTTVPDDLPDENGMDDTTHSYMLQWSREMLSQMSN